MGQQQTNFKISDPYKIIRIQDDGSTLLKHRLNGDEHLLRIISSYLQDQINGFENVIRQRKQIQSLHLLNIIQIQKITQKNICSILQKIYLLIQYPFKNLNEEIIERSQYPQKKYFAQNQLWSILYSCCIGLKQLYSHGFAHQSLQTKQIYISRDGLIKISDPIVLNIQKNYIKALKKNNNPHSESYNHISPQIMNFLDDCNFSYYDKQKSDVFILGCLLIEAALLQNIYLYDSHTKKLYLNDLNSYINQIKNRYSNQFSEIITQMVCFQSKLRPNFTNLIKKIQNQNNKKKSQQNNQDNNYLKNQQKINAWQTLSHTNKSKSNQKMQINYDYPHNCSNQINYPNNSHHIKLVKDQIPNSYYPSNYLNSPCSNQIIINEFQSNNSHPFTKIINNNKYQNQQILLKPYSRIVPKRIIEIVRQPEHQHQHHILNQHKCCLNIPSPIRQATQQLKQFHVPISQKIIHRFPSQRFSLKNFSKIKLDDLEKQKQQQQFTKTIKIVNTNKIDDKFYNPCSKKIHKSIHKNIPINNQLLKRNIQNKYLNNQIYNLSFKKDLFIQQLLKKQTSIRYLIQQNLKELQQDKFSQEFQKEKQFQQFQSLKKLQLYPSQELKEITESHDYQNVNGSKQSLSNRLITPPPVLSREQTPTSSMQQSINLKQIQSIPQIIIQASEVYKISATSLPAIHNIHHECIYQQQQQNSSQFQEIDQQQSLSLSKSHNTKQILQKNITNKKIQIKNIKSKQNVIDQKDNNNHKISFELFDKNQQNWQCSKLNSNLLKQQIIFVMEDLPNGSRYQGFKKSNKKNGQGKLYFQDGGYYQGQWLNNKMHGYGKLYYQNGHIAYQGFWDNDQFSGKGRVFNDHSQQFKETFIGKDFTKLLDKWLYYEGQFYKDSKHGKGKIKLSNGQTFQGNFIFDVIEGQGCFYNIDGTILKGIWKQNIYQQSNIQ